MHDDMKFDDFLRDAAKDYKSSPSARVDEIWAAIEPEVQQAIAAKSRSFATLRMTYRVGLGIAAALVIGVSVGRWSTRSGTEPHVAVQQTPIDTVGAANYARANALEHLAQTEVFLTSVRADLKAGRTDNERADRSRELLVRTRLLLGTSATKTPEVQHLLEDLELLLAEIAALPPARSSMDKQLLNESMRDGNILPRIRATLPAQSAGT